MAAQNDRFAQAERASEAAAGAPGEWSFRVCSDDVLRLEGKPLDLLESSSVYSVKFLRCRRSHTKYRTDLSL